jgi:competence protein ComEA
VYLVGEVARPGIYQVERGTYLYELVETAGGLTPRAAADRTNLVYRIEGSQLLRIPSVEDAADPGLAGSEVLSPSGQDAPFININSAGESELDGLPGIGPSTARAIIAFRETNGPFASIEEIMNVPGIKQSRFEAIRDAITT